MATRSTGTLRVADRELHAKPPLPPPRIPDVSLPDALVALRDLIASIPSLAGPLMDSSSLDNRDPEFFRRVAPLFYAISWYYFRSEGFGLENIPRERPFIAVGNHSGPPLLPDVLVAGAWWAMEIGVDCPVYVLGHDLPLRIPILGNMMMKVGALRASRENAEKALAAGASILIYPGGDAECVRPFFQRDRIDLRGNTGFVQLAFRHGVPILPFANVGGSEVYFTLFAGESLARWTGYERLTRVKSLPLNFGLPWGFWLTSLVPYLPLPTKISYSVGSPIDVERSPELANNRTAVGRVYQRVTRSMQTMVDDMARRRRFPVIG
jgi:1-acyl-sn-glycerol-3-phosphate acyltransferase